VAAKQSDHYTLVRLPRDFIQRESDCAVTGGVRYHDVKQLLFITGKRSLIEASNEALRLEAAKAAAGPLPKLRM
jgi:hypothetical protein